jgi:2-polyprenyl-3-methyl-5-hydroxy-6-metoxy-1,4-benzoquinol methylase
VKTLDAVVWCPTCRGARPLLEGQDYVCPACDSRFPVIAGIPRLLEDVPEHSRQIQRVFDFEHRRYRDSWYTRFEPRLVDQFLDDSELPREFFADARALDAGCGSGRWTYALSELGADVVAFDLTSGGIEVAHKHLGAREDVSICQANVFRPPFREETFDFVMSWGVLHHTPDTRAAFESLVPLVKPGGTLYVMVYERVRPLRLFGTNVVRQLLRRLPDERRYRACRRLVIRNRTLARFLDPLLMIAHCDPESAEVDALTLQFGLYDAYSPRYNHVHTRAEVLGWFDEAGFEHVTALAAHETVKVRGVRADKRRAEPNVRARRWDEAAAKRPSSRSEGPPTDVPQSSVDSHPD